jgi:raffinose/stachyose/melibiose transport system substrate-binding protein
MKQVKKILSIILVIVMLLAVGTGCTGQQTAKTPEPTGTQGASNTPEPADDQPVTLKLTAALPFQSSVDVLNKVIERNKQLHPNVTIELSVIKDFTPYKLAFDSGLAPDISTLDDTNQQLYCKNGYLMDIAADVKERGWIEKSLDGAIEFNARREPEKIYTVPYVMAPVLAFYNKDVFEKAGVTVPKTWDEFETTLAKIKEAGFIPFEANADSILWTLYDIVMNDAPRSDVESWYYLKETTPAFEKAFTGALTDFERWMKAGYFRKNITSVDPSTVSVLFGKGETAIMMDGDWDYQNLEATGANIGVFTFPSKNNTGKHIIVNAPDVGYALSSTLDEQKKTAALDFIDNFFDPEVVQWYCEAGFTPTVKFDTSKANVSPLKREMLNLVDQTEMGYFMDNAVPGLYGLYQKDIQEVLLGNLDSAGAWEKMIGDYDSLKKDYVK